MKKTNLPIILLVMLLVNGCTSSPTPLSQGELPVAESTLESTPGSTATTAFDVSGVNCVFATLQPATVKGELLNSSGTDSQTTTLSIAADTNIRIYWDQNASQSFELVIVRTDATTNSETGNKQTIETYLGPSSGCSDTILPKGEYQVIVTTSGGAWNVVIQEVTTKNE